MGNKRKDRDEDPQETMQRLIKKMNKVARKVEKVRLLTQGDANPQTQGEEKENVYDNEQNSPCSLEKTANEDDETESPGEFSEGENEWQDIVGEDPTKSKALEVEIKDDLLAVWKSFCRQGIKKEDEEALLQKYEVAKDLNVPEVNPQVAAKLSTTAKARDGHMVTIQKLASLSLTVIGSLMTKIHNSRKEGMDLLDILEPLRDAGKLLALQVYKQSMNRRAFIEPGMSKEGQDIIKDSKIEEMLFGNDLGTKIKESKAFSKEADNLMKAQPSTSTLKPLNSKAPSKGRPRSQAGYTSYQGRQAQKFSFKGRQSNNRYQYPNKRSYQKASPAAQSQPPPRK